MSGQWVDSERDQWEQERMAAELDLIDIRLRTGQGEELVARLSAWTAQHPLDERVAGQYMLALYSAGRPADALAHYRLLRERLVEQLGTDPGPTLQNLHRQILTADPSLIAAPTGTVAEPIVPRQLPAAPLAFVGRQHELRRLDATQQDTSVATVAISAITGAGGIGKTWLALHWAHRHLDRFPDGQLFVDLRGFSPNSAPIDPAVAVRGFLDALGVAPGSVPLDPNALAGLYRSVMADKRMLIIAGNARDAAQVVPLLPGSSTCTVLVTSRDRLTELLTRHGGRPTQVDLFPPTDARQALATRIGAERMAAEPKASQEILAYCNRHPLALGIVAAAQPSTHTFH